ncbi:uncharacterized protein LOC121385724 [Gigantopelta aegis]|uniref:uncharacterized protein LOC121385724 n=1 Tax=Gigantopelta aegis TaxID=1735272 RepID=UPI001B887FBE|nr:uncharacterized protein LOC121385724 [Gigantopelta aegis]XP_041372425.1 uncharacterized protein LOC121385724 [Gigantopelta aegis]XP_041372426.1 uncharacterized protein LOC121385724 [Gigantopelta aegis]XP_041372427.1 uncharacterized protein LOC121385724 [Gigantopelta aegis]
MSEGDAIRILSWAEFVACPHKLSSLFTKSGGTFIYDEQVVCDLTTPESSNIGLTLQRHQLVLIVQNVDHMAYLMEEFLRKLLLMRVTVIHTEIASRYSVETISILEDDFAVLVNSRHPSIKTRLTDGLKRAATCMSRCEKFCLEFDMSELIGNWYSEQRGAITSCDDIHQVKTRRTRIYVTNHSIYKHCFDCQTKWCFFLCICWLFSAPCYMSYRSFTCVDIYISLQGEIISANHMQDETSRVAVTSQVKGYQAL